MNQANSGSIMQGLLAVKSKTFLTPHYIRIVLSGDDIGNFRYAQVGDNNKLLIPNEHTDFSVEGRPEGDIRTYTLRALDLAKGEMTVDFVAHGEEGPASNWAINAQVSDQLMVFMKQKNKQLFKPADWYCLVGDHTALPVISVILESLPEDAVGKVLLEVYSSEDVLELQKPVGVDIQWIYNDHPGEQTLLPDFFTQIEIPENGTRFLYSAAEFQSVRAIQDQIRSKEFISRDEWQSFSYWKYGVAESDPKNNKKELTHRG